MPKGVKYGGRTKGTPNKATASVKELAMVYVPAAIEGLAKIASDSGMPAQARVAAYKELLDRGVGKSIATQIIQAEVTTPKSLSDFYGEQK